jgi:hypothetical protein
MKMLTEFGHESCTKRDSASMDGPPLCMEDREQESNEDFDMEGLVGHGSYIHMCTRPDIGHAIRALSRFTKLPPGKRRYGHRIVLFAKHLLRYLRGTVDLGLQYASGYPLYAQIFTDASHANCPDTRRSTISVVVKVGGNTVYWKTYFTKIVSHSSCESELMALDRGATISQMVKWLIEALGGPVQDAIQIFVDNQGTIDISSNPIQSGRNIHVHARYFYVRDLVYDELVSVCKIATGLQIADVGCSSKGAPNLIRLRIWLMNCARIVHYGANIAQCELWPKSLSKPPE